MYLVNAVMNVTLHGGTRGPALRVCATVMLLCFMYCLFRTAEDVCPYGLCLINIVAFLTLREAHRRPKNAVKTH